MTSPPCRQGIVSCTPPWRAGVWLYMSLWCRPDATGVRWLALPGMRVQPQLLARGFGYSQCSLDVTRCVDLQCSWAGCAELQTESLVWSNCRRYQTGHFVSTCTWLCAGESAASCLHVGLGTVGECTLSDCSSPPKQALCWLLPSSQPGREVGGCVSICGSYTVSGCIG